MIDHYKELEISETATQEEIKSSFRRLAKKWHPDRNPNNKSEAEEKFKKISSAYEILSDQNKRQMYDRQKNNPWSAPEGFYGHENVVWDNININIEDLFNINYGKTKRKVPGRDMRISLIISLKEAVCGFKKSIQYTRNVLCKKCKGIGGTDIANCIKCNGSGRISFSHGKTFWTTYTTCPECSGSGKQVLNKCSNCNMGQVEDQTSIEVNVPGGINDGSIMNIFGYGEETEGGAGNLQILFNVLEDKNFKREGNDLKTDVLIPLKLALNGGIVNIENIKGENIQLEIPKGCPFGHIIHKEGHGIKNNGKLLIEVKIELPILSDEQLIEISKHLP